MDGSILPSVFAVMGGFCLFTPRLRLLAVVHPLYCLMLLPYLVWRYMLLILIPAQKFESGSPARGVAARDDGDEVLFLRECIEISKAGSMYWMGNEE